MRALSSFFWVFEFLLELLTKEKHFLEKKQKNNGNIKNLNMSQHKIQNYLFLVF
jgi:hypothetical protein